MDGVLPEQGETVIKKRLLYFCSYVPVKHLESMGFEMVAPGDETEDERERREYEPSRAICGYMQAFGRMRFEVFDGVILAHCCSSTERLYDYLRYRFPSLFIHILELPGQMNKDGEERLMGEYASLFSALQKHFGYGRPAPFVPAEKAFSVNDEGILLLGGGVHPGWYAMLRSIFHPFSLKIEDCLSSLRGDGLLHGKGRNVCCPHMLEYPSWLEQQLEKGEGEIRAVIGIYSPKCDYALFSIPLLMDICRRRGRPFLAIEEAFTPLLGEQNRIRLEAFRESLPEERMCADGQRRREEREERKGRGEEPFSASIPLGGRGGG